MGKTWGPGLEMRNEWLTIEIEHLVKPPLQPCLCAPILLPVAQNLLEAFDDRFGKTATLFVSQVPVADWHARFPDPTLGDALLDRTIHNAYRLSLIGDSQRKLLGSRNMRHT